MVRTFATHRIRKTQELSSCLWDFETLPEEGGTVGETAGGKETAPVKEAAPGKGTAPVKMKTAVPGCWENCPDTLTYRERLFMKEDLPAKATYAWNLRGSAIRHRYILMICG